MDKQPTVEKNGWEEAREMLRGLGYTGIIGSYEIEGPIRTVDLPTAGSSEDHKTNNPQSGVSNKTQLDPALNPENMGIVERMPDISGTLPNNGIF